MNFFNGKMLVITSFHQVVSDKLGIIATVFCDFSDCPNMISLPEEHQAEEREAPIVRGVYYTKHL